MNGPIVSFSMEFGLLDEKTGLTTPHAGGLGVKEGDEFLTYRDLGYPYVAVCLKPKNHYVTQEINENGEQVELDRKFDFPFTDYKESVASVKFNGSELEIACYEYRFPDNEYPVLLYLETNNNIITNLYRGDRLAQSAVLGIGGVRVLKKLGYDLNDMHFKINEGDPSFALLELLKEFDFDANSVRSHSSFITHTPLNHGHVPYELDDVRKNLHQEFSDQRIEKELTDATSDGKVVMSKLGSNLSGKVFAVSAQHWATVQRTFPGKQVSYITNGVHRDHLSKYMQDLFGKHLGEGWRTKPEMFYQVSKIPVEEVQYAHDLAKADLIDYVAEQTGVRLSMDKPITGWLRRQTAYKQPNLLLSDIDKLRSIAEGRLQHIQGGIAHPDEAVGKQGIKTFHEKVDDLKSRKVDMTFVFIKNYNLSNHRTLLNGLDLLLYTSLPLDEACSTGFMKSMWSGVPVLGTPAGGFPEFCVDGINGFSFNGQDEFYSKLNIALDMYEKDKLAEMRKNAMFSAVRGSSVRMVREFLSKSF